MPQGTFSATGPTAAILGEDIAPDDDVWSARVLRPKSRGAIIRNTIAIYGRYWETICLIYILPSLPSGMLRDILETYWLSGWVGTLFLEMLDFFLVSVLGIAALTVAVSDICLNLKPN